MAEIHLVVGVAVMALNLIAGVWGAALWIARRPSIRYWYAVRAAQGSVILQVLLGAVLLLAGREAKDAIHYMYGASPLLVNFFAEGMRIGAAQREVAGRDFASLDSAEQRRIGLRIVRRETGIMSIACLLIVAFAVRAAQVSGKMF
jgi:hypothetical protein